MACLNNKLPLCLAWLYFPTLIGEAVCSCKTRINLYRCVGSYHPGCQHPSYSNFPSLRSRSFHSNTKSNTEKRLKILTIKYPRFSLESRDVSIFIIMLTELFAYMWFGITLDFKIIYLMLHDSITVSSVFSSVVHSQKYIRIDYHRAKETNALSQCGPHQ
jgi:hypothetical protein